MHYYGLMKQLLQQTNELQACTKHVPLLLCVETGRERRKEGAPARDVVKVEGKDRVQASFVTSPRQRIKILFSPGSHFLSARGSSRAERIAVLC